MGKLSPCASLPVAPSAVRAPRANARPCINTTPHEFPATDMLTCTVYGPYAKPNGFDVLQMDWNPLLSQARFDTIFLTHEWQTTWWNHLGHGDPWILAFHRCDTGDLVGIVPLYHFRHEDGDHAGLCRLTLIGCIEVSDYLDAIMAAGWEEQVYAGLLTWLRSESAPPWDILDLCNLPEESLTWQTFPALAEEAGLRVTVRQEDVAPQFRLPQRYETYLQDYLDKKQRHEVRRKQRRAEQNAHVGFYIVNGREHCLEAEMDDFIALQRASRADKSEFMTPEMRRFFDAMAHAMLDAGHLCLSFLTLDGEKAAALLAFNYKGRYLLYNSGYDPDDHGQLSPGWVLLSYCIQYAIASGMWLFDFMQGDEEYKFRFGSQEYKVMRVLVQKDEA